jgi:subtilisin-like proprotein convertase family protein
MLDRPMALIPEDSAGLRSVLEDGAASVVSPVATSRRGADVVRDFVGSGSFQSAKVTFEFGESPEICEGPSGGYVRLEGETLWVNPGDPMLPVRTATILLPASTQTVEVSIRFSGEAEPVNFPWQTFVTPVAVVQGVDYYPENLWEAIPVGAIAEFPPVRYQEHAFRGFRLLTVQVFPVHWDDHLGQMVYRRSAEVEIGCLVDVDARVASESGTYARDLSGELGLTHSLEIRGLPADFALISSLVVNPGTLASYVSTASLPSSGRLPRQGSFEYVIVTSSDLAPIFEALAQHKASRGMSATVVTTDWIRSRYPGRETGDLADRIREFLTEAYLYWGTEWVLLGGDSEIIPARGVYANVGSTVERFLPTDLYYACLDGTWDGNGNGIWGEATDGLRGGDVDLVAELFVGRAPVSTPSEAWNFVRKVVQYETSVHPNRTVALWLGEALDARTDASYSGDIIRDRTIPSGWTVIERYDRDWVWTRTELVNLLNNSPHLVNHLGHANHTINARLRVDDVANLQNQSPYFFYSQGCHSGAFDLQDVAVGEQHIISRAAALAGIFNTRYGWYVPGPTPGGNHYHALEFWDAVFNEHLYQLGLAHHDARMDNLFRVGSTGVYRWIHFGTILLGDPETALQIQPPQSDDGSRRLFGRVVSDGDGDGRAEAGEPGIENVLVYLDTNGDGKYNQGGTSVTWQGGPQPIPDAGVLRSVIEVAAPGQAGDIRVSLTLQHQYLNDLEAYLISPSGRRLRLFSRPPVASGGFDQALFTDTAPQSLSFESYSPSGKFRPIDPLSALAGEKLQGTWVLEIVDTTPQDAGVLVGWSLEISYEEPSVRTDAQGVYVFEGLIPDAYTVRIEVPGGWDIVSPASGAHTVQLGSSAQAESADFLLRPVSWPSSPVNWGSLAYREERLGSLQGDDQWYRFTASSTGVLTIVAEASAVDSQNGLWLELYDSGKNRLARAEAGEGKARLDLMIRAGEELYLRVHRVAPIRLLAVNLLEIQPGKVVLKSTPGSDDIALQLGEILLLEINGLTYRLLPEQSLQLVVTGGGGEDRVRVDGSNLSETFVYRDNSLRVSSSLYQCQITGVARLEIDAFGGSDVAWLYDSPGNDLFQSSAESASWILGSGVTIQLRNFEKIHALATRGGKDEAQVWDAPGKDRVFLRPGEAISYGVNRTVTVRGFSQIDVHSADAQGDVVYFLDSSGADRFLATPQYALMQGEYFVNRASGFRWVVARSSRGADQAQLYDSAGRDELLATPQYVVLSGAQVSIRVENFPLVEVNATAGSGDFGRLFDSAGNDFLTVTPDLVRLTSSRSTVVVHSVDTLRAYSQKGGTDVAEVLSTNGTYRVQSSPGWLRVHGQGTDLQLVGFARAVVTASPAGQLSATLYDATPLDNLLATERYLRLSNQRYEVALEGFARVLAYSRFGAKVSSLHQQLDYLLETTGSWLLS